MATAAAAFVTIETGLQVVTQLIALIQTAQASGQPIDVAAWTLALSARDSALSKLDADIHHAVQERKAAQKT